MCSLHFCYLSQQENAFSLGNNSICILEYLIKEDVVKLIEFFLFYVTINIKYKRGVFILLYKYVEIVVATFR